MGGEREEVIAAKAKSPISDVPQTIGKLRVHESKGEVHFHDDANQRKVAIVAGQWYNIWESLRTGIKKKVKIIDPKNNTVLRIRMKQGKNAITPLLSIEPATLSPEFEQLERFTNCG